MSLKFHPIERKVLAGEDAGQTKWFGQVRLSGTIYFDKLCEKIAALSTATKGDVEIVLKSLIFVLCEKLSNGNVAQVGDLGNFRVSAGSEGAIDPEEFNARMMRRPKIVFFPGKRLQRLRKEARFEQLPVKEIPGEEPDGEE